MGAERAALKTADPEAERRGARHGREDARLAQTGLVDAAQDAHRSRHEDADRQALHRARYEEQDPQLRADHAGHHRVPRRLPQERADHQRLRRGEVRERPGDDDGEPARQEGRAHEPGGLRRADAQGVAEGELRDRGVAVRQGEDDLARRAHGDEYDLGEEVGQLRRHALRDGIGRAAGFVPQAGVRRPAVARKALGSPAADDAELQHRVRHHLIAVRYVMRRALQRALPKRLG